MCSALNSVSTASIPCATLLGQQMMLRTSVDVNIYGQLVAREQQRQRFIGEHSQALPNAAKDDAHEPTVMPKVLHDWHHVTSCVMFGKPSKLSIPLYISSDQIGDINISRLVSVFRQDVMRIFTGILAGQRILFVGYGHAARDIAQMVMSAVAMISPALIGVTRRAYPYVTLSDLSFLDTRGYIAGCTNPMFTQKKSWCDLLCILDLPHNKGTVVENTPLKNLTVDELADMHGQQQTATSPRLARSIESAPDAGEGWISGLSDSPGASISDKHSRSANDDAMYVAAGEGRDSVYFAHTLVEVSLTAHAVHDKEWITALLSEIEVERASEELVRRRFQDLTLQLVLHAQDAPGTSASPRWSDAAKKAAQIHAYRTELLRAATEFQDAMKFSTSPFLDAARYWASSSVGSASSTDVGAVPVSATESEKDTLKGSSDTNISAITNSSAQSSHIPLSRGQAVICRNHVRRLATYATLHWSETEVIFKDLDKALSTEYAFCALLVCFPAEQGVHLIGTGLLSCSPTVRKCAVRILQRLRSYPSASAAFSFLNGILKKAYSRVTAKDRNGVLESELNNWNAASQAALADAMRHQRQPSDSSLVLADAY